MRTADLVDNDFWRLMPVINVDKTKEVPSDWLGAIGVPITFLAKDCNERFQILARGDNLKIDGKQLYKRIIVKNNRPDLPETIDLAAYVRKFCDAELALTLVTRRERMEQDKGGDARI